MYTPDELIELFKNNEHIIEFFEKDVKTTNEVLFCIGESGTTYQIREGEKNSVTFYALNNTDEDLLVIHTHPSIGDTNLSTSDKEAIVEEDNTIGMIVLRKHYFEPVWEGSAYNTDLERRNFEVFCEGVTDGPKEERYIDSISFNS